MPVGQLTHEYRMPILHNNIFGVDLDQQAVEIARLNLLLRALAQRQLLPTLSDNVKRGNSLISGGEAELKPYFGDAWRDKHPFEWEQEFPDIVEQGGFDVVIGNPPYVGFHGFDEDKSYYRSNYDCATGRFDIYMPFIEKGIELLKPDGLLGFICPTNFMKRQHGGKLRQLLRKQHKIVEIVDFEHEQVFEEALNYTCLLVIQKGKPFKPHHLRYFRGGISLQSTEVQQDSLSDTGWVFASESQKTVLERVKLSRTVPLGTLLEGISEGIVTGKNNVFVLPNEEVNQLEIESSLTWSAIQGKQIDRYCLRDIPNVVLYPYKRRQGIKTTLPERELRRRFPNAYQYLKSRKRDLAGRRYFDESAKAWYELWNERSFDQQAVSKIVVSELGDHAKFALADKTLFYLDTVCGLVPKKKGKHHLGFLLGLLNSKLLDYIYKATTVPKAGGFYIYKTMFLRRLPIRHLDLSNAGEKGTHDRIASLVEEMLVLQAQLAPVRGIPSTERDGLQHAIALKDAEIDEAVYDLYGLTKAERRLVEEETTR